MVSWGVSAHQVAERVYSGRMKFPPLFVASTLLLCACERDKIPPPIIEKSEALEPAEPTRDLNGVEVWRDALRMQVRVRADNVCTEKCALDKSCSQPLKLLHVSQVFMASG